MSLTDAADHPQHASFAELLTEKALLGALLLDASQISHVREWLQPQDFYRPQHQSLYAEMLRLSDLFPPSMLADLAVRVLGEASTPGVDGVYLHNLMDACPQAHHAPAYGRMVVEADARRAIAMHVTRLVGALDQAADGHLDHERIGMVAATARRTVAHLARRLNVDLTATTTDVGDQSHSRITPADEAATRREDELLTALIARPQALDSVREFLDSADFQSENRGPLFTVLQTMSDQGEPIDTITVLEQAIRHGLVTSHDHAADFWKRFRTNHVQTSASITALAVEVSEAATTVYANAATSRLLRLLNDRTNRPDHFIAVSASELDGLLARHERTPPYRVSIGDQSAISPAPGLKPMRG